MFNRYNLRTANYSTLNSYLTMVASHQVFPFAYDPKLPPLAYKAPATAFFIRNGLFRVEFINGGMTGADGLVASNNRFAMLVLRGTEMGLTMESLLDVFTDVKLQQVNGGRFGRGVHRGFRDAAQSLQPQVIRALRRAGAEPGSNKPIVVCGHSLGAALATLLGHMLTLSGYRVKAVYAHASPMVGDAAFGRSVARLDTPYFRTVNQNDPVPEFPQAFIDIGTALASMAGQAPPIQSAVNLLWRIPTVRNFISAPYEQAPMTTAYIRRRRGITMNPSRERLVRDRGPFLDFEKHNNHLYLRALHLAIPLATRRRVPLIN